MVDKKEKTKQESMTLPIWAVEIVDKMSNKGFISTSKSEIYRHFVIKGLNEMIDRNFIEKAIKTKELLND